MRPWIRLGALFGWLLLVSCNRNSSVAVSDYRVPEQGALQARTFESLLKVVSENYVYEELVGAEWEATGERYRTRLKSDFDSEEFSALVDEMLAELPEGTVVYQSRSARIEQAAADDSSYEGIGAYVSVRELPEPRIVILTVMPDSPAEQAGLAGHDAILSIDGERVASGNASEQIARVRGPSGSDVSFTVRSPGEDPRPVSVTRDRIEPAHLRLSFQALGETKVGYFLLPPSNYEELQQDFVLGMRALDAAGDLDAMIIDLRIVSAGGDWPFSTLLTLFTDGEVGAFHSRSTTRLVAINGVFDFLGSQDLPVALIVGPTTTGSAEIFAATMQATGKAILVGGSTTGAVEAMSTFPLPDGSRVFVATTSYRTGSGVELGLSGLEPDIPVAADWDEVTALNDPALLAALRGLTSGGG